MGFISQMILLSILGFLSHYIDIYKGKRLKNPRWRFAYCYNCVSLFILFAILMYTGVLNFLIPYLNQIPWIDYLDGKDFMWNSGHLIGLSKIIVYQPGLDIIAVFLILNYISSFVVWKMTSQFFFGSRTYERGILFGLQPAKK